MVTIKQLLYATTPLGGRAGRHRSEGDSDSGPRRLKAVLMSMGATRVPSFLRASQVITFMELLFQLGPYL